MEGFGRALCVDDAVTVESMEGFESNFNRQHANVLHRIRHVLREEPLVIAGGSVLAALRPEATTANADRDAPPSSKDIDMFICTTDKVEAGRIAERVWKALAVDHEQWAIVRSSGTQVVGEAKHIVV
jgi:hypothetical protein